MLSWMQTKIQGKPAATAKKPSNPFLFSVTLNHVTQQACSREEFCDWRPASGLLAIGTFGLNKNLQKPADDDYDEQKLNPIDPQTCARISQDVSGLTPEEVLKKMSQEFCSMIEDDEHVVESGGDMKKGLESDKFGKLERTNGFVLGRGKSKDGCTNNVLKKEIGKRSLSFLFKKIYTRGFLQSPGLRDAMPESRIDKILTALLHKKIYPQTSSATVAAKKKWLKNQAPAASVSEDDNIMHHTAASNVSKKDSKWIKTDSEFIVLEF